MDASLYAFMLTSLWDFLFLEANADSSFSWKQQEIAAATSVHGKADTVGRRSSSSIASLASSAPPPTSSSSGPRRSLGVPLSLSVSDCTSSPSLSAAVVGFLTRASAASST